MVYTIACVIFLPLSVHAKGYLTETNPLPQLSSNGSTCCHHGGLGRLDSGDYKPKGVTETVEGLPIYRVGQGEKCLIWNYDIFGLNSGRTKQTADLFAEQGYMVLVPDYYRGEMRDPTVDKDFMAFMQRQSNWAGQLEQDWLKRIRPHALKHGAKRFGSLGTCWGTYVTLKLCGRGEIEVGVGCARIFSLFFAFFNFFRYFSHFYVFFFFFAFFRIFTFFQIQAYFSLFSTFFAFFAFFHFFSLNFRFASIFSLHFRLFYLRFRFRFLVFRIKVNYVKSGFFRFQAKRNFRFNLKFRFRSESEGAP
jgi:hypothetical protein